MSLAGFGQGWQRTDDADGRPLLSELVFGKCRRQGWFEKALCDFSFESVESPLVTGILSHMILFTLGLFNLYF